MTTWFRELYAEDKQFLIEKDFEKNNILVITYDNNLFYNIVINCEDKEHMDDLFYQIEEDDCIEYYYKVLGSTN